MDRFNDSEYEVLLYDKISDSRTSVNESGKMYKNFEEAMTMFLFIGIPIIGWIFSLIAMKFYPLDKDKMIEVQAKIANLKKQA